MDLNKLLQEMEQHAATLERTDLGVESAMLAPDAPGFLLHESAVHSSVQHQGPSVVDEVVREEVHEQQVRLYVCTTVFLIPSLDQVGKSNVLAAWQVWIQAWPLKHADLEPTMTYRVLLQSECPAREQFWRMAVCGESIHQ